MFDLRNLTPHDLVVEDDSGGMITIPPAGEPARVSYYNERGDALSTTCGDFNIHEPVFGQVSNLPAPQTEVFLVVSRLVAERHPDREDLLFPGRLIRDDGGRVVACRGFCRLRA